MVKGCGLNPLNYFHHNDHLGPVCSLLHIPLLVSGTDALEKTVHYYPDLHVEEIEWGTLTLEYLIERYDTLFRSDIWEKERFHAQYRELEEKYGKTMRTVHCPHGFSDKGFWLEKCYDEDMTLVYGQNMLDLLAERTRRPLKNYVMSGNYRLPYYQQHKPQLDAITDAEVFSKFGKSQRTLLYAPTWKDQENSSSFFEVVTILLNSLPRDWNMIVKLHPQLEQNDIAFVYALIARNEFKDNVVILQDFPLVYPLLSRVDAYLGDASSVGYDMLAFGKPLFFLNHRGLSAQDRSAYLLRCGWIIPAPQAAGVYEFIERHLPQDTATFGAIRKEVYDYTFGTPKTLPEIRAIIEKGL